MTTYKISAMPKGFVIPSGPFACDYSDWFEAETEAEARALWEKDNQEFCDGNLAIVSVTIDQSLRD